MNDVRLVEARLRQHEVGPLGVELLERLLEGGEPEEPVLLLSPVERRCRGSGSVPSADLGPPS